MTQTTAPAFRIVGRTDQVTECEHCSRTDLTHTVVLVPLDADGTDDGDVVHYGAVCGARAAGVGLAAFRRAITAAERARVEAARAERARAEIVDRAAVRLTYGTAECLSGPTMCRIELGGSCVAHP